MTIFCNLLLLLPAGLLDRKHTHNAPDSQAFNGQTKLLVNFIDPVFQKICHPQQYRCGNALCCDFHCTNLSGCCQVKWVAQANMSILQNGDKPTPPLPDTVNITVSYIYHWTWPTLHKI